MLILLAQIQPQLIYIIAYSRLKQTNIISNLYENSQMVTTLWMDWHKKNKSAADLWKV